MPWFYLRGSSFHFDYWTLQRFIVVDQEMSVQRLVTSKIITVCALFGGDVAAHHMSYPAANFKSLYSSPISSPSATALGPHVTWSKLTNEVRFFIALQDYSATLCRFGVLYSMFLLRFSTKFHLLMALC